MSNTPEYDYFSQQAEDYAASRPGYPPQLFAWLASQCPKHQRALDCAAGNGQASHALLEHFEEVVASDLSLSQLRQAPVAPELGYLCSSASSQPLIDTCIDLICVAQAWHWFATREFEQEALRLLKPQGILAIWGYNLLSISPGLDDIIKEYYFEIAGLYWPEERRILEQGYQDFPFLLTALPAPQFAMNANWTRPRLEQYLASWSATRRLIDAKGMTPFEATLERIRRAWPKASHPMPVTWPLTLKIGKKSC